MDKSSMKILQFLQGKSVILILLFLFFADLQWSTDPHDILPILFWIIHMLSGKLQTGLDMYWLKQGDAAGTAGFESLSV